ncbi:MAG: alanine racemase [Gammaproteobacteria bacterium]|nr:alanine racemase [Gammaproteobacteria bacterium]MCP5135957.1 alanine racemase [Gammaproteobacteria bacterium]
MTRAAWVEIDRSALRHNLAVARQHAHGARVIAVIKANGYGHGQLRVAEQLRDADAFAVASVDEALRLRKSGFDHPIVLLAGVLDAEELALIADRDIEPVIHQAAQLDLFRNSPVSSRFRVWLKLDTGMHRLGFDVAGFRQAYEVLRSMPEVVSEIRFLTHLANADDRNDALTQTQLALFDTVTAGMDGARSAANSGGVMGWPSASYDWVRPGLMLYGVSPFLNSLGVYENLKPVMAFKTRLIAIKALNAGDRVGYGGHFTAPQAMRMGVIAAGYGDGYPRHVDTRAEVLLNGKRARIIGRVSMDLICIDLSGQDQAALGDEVVLWGPGLPVETVASYAGTIPYELLCQVAERVRVHEI